MVKTLDPIADIVVTSILMDQPMNSSVNELTLEQAFDVQDLVGERLAAPQGGLAGYKIAWNSDALKKKMEMPHPGMGRVFRKAVRNDGAKLALRNYNDLMIEVEIVAFLSADIKPGTVHTAENVGPCISSFTAGFEVLDRHKGSEHANAPSILAHNVFNAGVILGDRRLPLEDLDSIRMTTRFFQGEKIITEGKSLAPQNPLDAVAFISNHFTGRGVTLKAGEMILCGSHIPLFKVNHPGEFSASLGPLGDVSFTAI